MISLFWAADGSASRLGQLDASLNCVSATNSKDAVLSGSGSGQSAGESSAAAGCGSALSAYLSTVALVASLLHALA
jgi:hypothetical protein